MGGEGVRGAEDKVEAKRCDDPRSIILARAANISLPILLVIQVTKVIFYNDVSRRWSLKSAMLCQGRSRGIRSSGLPLSPLPSLPCRRPREQNREQVYRYMYSILARKVATMEPSISSPRRQGFPPSTSKVPLFPVTNALLIFLS